MHCVRLSRDGLVYVCDRANDRIQIFNKDARFVKEFQIVAQTLQNGFGLGLGVLRRPRPAVHLHRRWCQLGAHQRLASFGRPGHMVGNFKWVHNIAIDSKGTIYTAEVGDGRRAQKFKRAN